MKSKMLGCLSVGLVLCGCGKHSETPAAGPSAVATENPAGPANASAPDLSALTGNLRGWIVTNRRLPANFEEFATLANLKVPPPPPGKKYAIEKSTVILVNR